MIQKFLNLEIKTNGLNLYEINDKIINWIKLSKFKNGILNISIQHTSASLIIQENADPDVQSDLINYFDKLVPMNSDFEVSNIAA
jgi:secondary thiamine-phosphate synthase enzyme